MNSEYYLMVNSQKVKVSKEIYQTYWQETNRENYLRALERENGVMPFSFFLEKDTGFEEHIMDERMDVEKVVETAMLIEEVQKALSTLTAEERELIEYLFFDEKSVREVAEIYKISHPAIIKRRDKILAKLKKFFE